MYKKIDPRTWSDEKFMRLSNDAKLMWLWLLTSEITTSAPGLVHAGPSTCAELMHLAGPGLDAFQELIDQGLIIYDPRVHVIRRPKCFKYDPPSSPNHVIAWHTSWDLIPDCGLKYEWAAELRELCVLRGPAFVSVFDHKFHLPSSGHGAVLADGETGVPPAPVPDKKTAGNPSLPPKAPSPDFAPVDAPGSSPLSKPTPAAVLPRRSPSKRNEETTTPPAVFSGDAPSPPALPEAEICITDLVTRTGASTSLRTEAMNRWQRGGTDALHVRRAAELALQNAKKSPAGLFKKLLASDNLGPSLAEVERARALYAADQAARAAAREQEAKDREAEAEAAARADHARFVAAWDDPTTPLGGNPELKARLDSEIDREWNRSGDLGESARWGFRQAKWLASRPYKSPTDKQQISQITQKGAEA